jgi:hypothetical protein
MPKFKAGPSRGLFRLWVVLSALWLLPVILLAGAMFQEERRVQEIFAYCAQRAAEAPSASRPDASEQGRDDTSGADELQGEPGAPSALTPAQRRALERAEQRLRLGISPAQEDETCAQAQRGRPFLAVVQVLAGAWALPSTLLFLLGLAGLWVARGFRG